MKRRVLAVLAAGLLALVGGTALGGCSTSGGHVATDSSPFFNDADVSFGQTMLAHYARGEELLTLARGRTLRPAVSTLVAAIDATERDEAQTIKVWLHSWAYPEEPIGTPAASGAGGSARSTSPGGPAASAHPDASASGMSGHGMSEHGMEDDITEQDIARLRTAGDAAFESAFLNTLIAHQHHAIDLARMETTGGINPGARDLAARIDKSRSAEISQMLGYVSK